MSAALTCISAVIMDGLMTLCPPSTACASAVWSPPGLQLPRQHFNKNVEQIKDELPSICLDAAILGDIPARYTISCVPIHSLPVIGVYVDPNIVPGFKYTVMVLPCKKSCVKEPYLLFGGEALVLESIGRGYSRRLTFAPNPRHPEEDTTFWSDSHPGGVAFALQVIFSGDSYNVFSSDGVLVGHCEITRVLGPQEELEQTCRGNSVEKKVKVVLESQTRWLDYRKGLTKEIVTGTACCVKSGNQKMIVKQVLLDNGSVLTAQKTGYQSICVGEAGLPTKYHINGLMDTEVPVIGTYVDPRILPGLKYQVRRLPEREMLFAGKARTLSSVGRGYGKRISFISEDADDNDFWSDSSPGGFAFQPVPVCEGTFLNLRDHPLKFEVSRVMSTSRLLHTVLSDAGLESVWSVDVLCHLLTSVRFRGTATYRRAPTGKVAELISVQLTPDTSVQQSKRHIDLIPR